MMLIRSNLLNSNSVTNTVYFLFETETKIENHENLKIRCPIWDIGSQRVKSSATPQNMFYASLSTPNGFPPSAGPPSAKEISENIYFQACSGVSQ